MFQFILQLTENFKLIGDQSFVTTGDIQLYQLQHVFCRLLLRLQNRTADVALRKIHVSGGRQKQHDTDQPGDLGIEGTKQFHSAIMYPTECILLIILTRPALCFSAGPGVAVG